MISKRKVKEFYRSLLNDNFYRDVRLVGGNLGYPLTTMARFRNKPVTPQVDVERITKNELLNYKDTYGTCAFECTWFNTEAEFREGKKQNRWANFFYFDFDSTSPELEALKDRFNEKNLTIKEKEAIASEFRDLVINSNVLSQPFEEARAMATQLRLQGIPSFPVFSGSAGVHLYVFFKPTPLKDFQNYQGAVKHFALEQAIQLYLTLNTSVYPQVQINKFLDNYECFLDDKEVLKEMALTHLTFDQSPISDAHKRIVRAVYSRNPKTNLMVVPFSWEESIDEVLARADNTEQVIKFEIEDYISDELLYQLKVSDLLAVMDMSRKKSRYQFSNTNNTTTVDNTGQGNTSYPFKDMRVLLRFIAPKYYDSSHDTYDLFNCVFHPYSHPCVVVSPYRYNCKSNSCNSYLGYFDFIKKYYKLKTNEEVKQKMNDISKAWNEGRDTYGKK